MMMRVTILLTLALTCLAWGQPEKKLAVRVYVLVGQSNMQGKAPIEGEGSNSLRYLVNHDPNKEFQFLVNDDGSWRERKDVWIHYDLYPFRGLRHGLLKPGYGSSDGEIGPELGFGHKIGDAYDGRVLLIKAAWGGKSLGQQEGTLDEIRLGPTYESVVGRGTGGGTN